MEKVTIDVDVPQPVIQNLKTATITSNTTTSITPDEGYDGIRVVSVTTNVPSNNETWTNKRLQTNNTYTISNLMNNNTKDGVSKESTIVVDVPQLDVTQISNYPITSNGTQSVPIPSGYDAVDSISLNVAISPRVATKVYAVYNDNFSNFTYQTSSGNVSLTPKHILYIIRDVSNSRKYQFSLYYNPKSDTSYNINVSSSSYYYLTTYTVNSVTSYELRDSSNNQIFSSDVFGLLLNGYYHTYAYFSYDMIKFSMFE